MHPELAIGAFLASGLVLLPLPGHWRARNIATVSIVVWLCFVNLTFAINSIIWSGNVDIVVPVWCDIVTKLQIGAMGALPACCLSLALQLWRVSSAFNSTSKRTAIMIDILWCWGSPALLMILHYIVQDHRFDIIEDLGCRPTTYISLPAVFLFYAPIALVVLLTFTFSSLAFSAFYQRRRTFASFLQSKRSPFTARRYVRLMLITTVLALWEATVVALIFGLSFHSSGGLRPYASWAAVHRDFSRINQHPAASIPRQVLAWTYVAWWTVPISAYCFVLFFSFGEEGMRVYGPWWRWVRRSFGLAPSPASGINQGSLSSAATSFRRPLARTYRASSSLSVLDIKADVEGESSLESAKEVKAVDINSRNYDPPRRVSGSSSSA